MVDAVIVSLVMRREVERQSTTEMREPRSNPAEHVEAIEREISSLHAAYAAGDMALDDLTPLLKSARVRLRDSQRAEADAIADDALTGSLLTWTDWLAMDLSQRRALLGRHLSGVLVEEKTRLGPRPDPGRLRLHWREGLVHRATEQDLADARWSSAKQAVNARGLEVTIGRPPRDAVLRQVDSPIDSGLIGRR